MASAERFTQMVVSTFGHMALMTTLHPATFSRLKLALSRNPGRDPLKKSRDALQARAVAELLEEMMQHLLLGSVAPAPTAGEDFTRSG